MKFKHLEMPSHRVLKTLRQFIEHIIALLTMLNNATEIEPAKEQSKCRISRSSVVT